MITGEILDEWLIAEKCEGCEHVTHNLDVSGNIKKTCTNYRFPAAMWGRGNCPRATHLVKEAKKEQKTSQDPIKLSKKKTGK